MEKVSYGTGVSVNGNEIAIGDNHVFAYPTEPTAQYTYLFVEWTGIPSDKIITGDTEITAVFSRTVNTYTVTFDAQEGSPVPETQSVEYGSKAIRPQDPSKTDRKFMGWFFDNKEWNFDDQVTKDITLVARWEGEFVVTFDVQGHGTAPEKQVLSDGQKVIKPQDPFSPEHLFRGWYKDSECIEKWDFETVVRSSFTLYAKWIPAECQISADKVNWTPC